MPAQLYRPFLCTSCERCAFSVRLNRGKEKVLIRNAVRQTAIPAERHDRPRHYPAVVGQHRVQAHGGLARDAAARRAGGRTLWVRACLRCNVCGLDLGLADIWRADRTLGRICCCSIRCICCCHLLSSLAYALGVGHRSCQGGGVLSAWNATGSLRAGVLGLGFDACMPGRVRALTYCRRRPRPIDAHRCARMHAVIIFGLRGCGYVCMCIHAGWGVREMRTGGVSMTGR